MQKLYYILFYLLGALDSLLSTQEPKRNTQNCTLHLLKWNPKVQHNFFTIVLQHNQLHQKHSQRWLLGHKQPVTKLRRLKSSWTLMSLSAWFLLCTQKQTAGQILKPEVLASSLQSQWPKPAFSQSEADWSTEINSAKTKDAWRTPKERT